jgi:hypothetical protein
MQLDHDAVNQKLGLSLRVSILRRSLTENERSWTASGLEGMTNPVANKLRKDLQAQEEALLALDAM